MKKRYEFFCNRKFAIQRFVDQRVDYQENDYYFGLIKITVNILLLLLFVKEFFIYIRDQCNSKQGFSIIWHVI